MRSTITAFGRVSLRHFASHKLRVGFTVCGVALGVASMIGMQLLHEAVGRSFERMVDRMAGKAVLEITNGTPGVPEELLDEVKAVSGVGAAAPSVQGFVSLPDHPGERIYVFGIDLLADGQLRDYGSATSEAVIEDPLVFLAKSDSVALTREFLEAMGFVVGDRLHVRASGRQIELTVRAEIDVDRGPATLFGGRLAVMDVFSAERLFDLDRRFTQIDVGLAPGATVERLEPALRAKVAGRAIVERPRSRGETLDRMLASHRYAFTLAAGLAIVVGLYLVFNTMMIAIAERRREFGILRALGMRRREILALVALESLALGAVGCAGGVALGLWLARALSVPFAANVSFLYLPVETPAISLRAMPVVWGVGLGALSALVAALMPAREAARVQPIEALRPSFVMAHSGDGRRPALVGAAGIGAAVIVWLDGRRSGLGEVASGAVLLLLLVGPSLFVPWVSRFFARAAEPLAVALLGSIGLLASRSLIARIGRAAITCAALVVSLAGAIGIATLISSLERTMNLWLDADFSKIDLMVTGATTNFSGFDVPPLPGRLVEEIAGVPEVDHVDAVRFARLPYGGSFVVLAAGGRVPQPGGRWDGRLLVEGDRDAVRTSMLGGEGVIANEAFTKRFHKHRGDVVELPTPTGERRLPIVGVFFDMNELGVLDIDRGLYRRLWRDDLVSFINPVLRSDADRETVAGEIRRRFGDRYDLSVITVDRFRREQETLLKQIFSISYPIIAMALAIALLGVVNSLFASVLDRTGEIGLLRAIGTTRAQVVRSIMVESGIIGGLGAGLAIAFGSALGYPLLDLVVRGIFSMTVVYRYPGSAVIFAALAAVVLSVAAGYLPGRSAARLKINEALDYE